jgi:hypothetical protein
MEEPIKVTVANLREWRRWREGVQSPMPDDAPKYSIRDDYDPDGDLNADADPVAAYLTYREDVRIGFVVEMRFTLEDFREYISSLRDTPK